MNLLLDTNVFLWWISKPEKLSEKTKTLISQGDIIFVSVASAWEIVIKQQLGKLEPGNLISDFEEIAKVNSFSILPIKLSHIKELEKLPPLHKDPFDRIMLSQAMAENVPLLTGDKTLASYNRKVLLN